MSIWRYDGDRYTFIQRQRLVTYASYSDCRVWLMTRDAYGEKPNEIFAAMGEFSVYRLALNAKEISQSHSAEVWSNKREKLVDYR